MVLGIEHVEEELRCPYCNSDEISNSDRLEEVLIHYWISCGKCGRNFQAKKKDKLFSIINADERYI